MVWVKNMKVSINWLKELVDLKTSVKELVELLPLKTIGLKEVTDQYIELDMKGYNRSDLLSLRGVAYEVSALTNSGIYFKEPQEPEFAWNQTSLPTVNVSVENGQLAPLYCIAKIEKIKVGKSSMEWSRKLEESGMRSINNIADVTNLVMLEYGQPLHAFDAEKIKGSVKVRVAKQGEKIKTIDGKIRSLKNTDLVIADEGEPIGIAGIMGGKDSEISDSTSTILLEAAIFDPSHIRKTTMSLGLPSEASKRFQHGLTKKRLLQALDAAIKQYQVLGGRLTAFTIVTSQKTGINEVKKIELRQEKLESLVGIKFGVSQVEDYLSKLNFKFEKVAEGWQVEPPYFRLDVNIEEDVIEEIARMYGYEKIPPIRVVETAPIQKEEPIFRIISDLKEKLFNLGLTEVSTYSFFSTEFLNAIEASKEYLDKLVEVANPISAETQYLRMGIWPNLIEGLGKNIKKGYKDIAIYEIAKSYIKENNIPKENFALSIALCNGSGNPAEELASILRKLDLKVTLTTGAPRHTFTNQFHPKRVLTIEKDGIEIGILAEVHLRVLDSLGIGKRVAIFEIDLDKKMP